MYKRQELFRLTKKSFRNLIREDEQKKIEASIWKQIDNGNENDYIHFHLRRADGAYLPVLDHGRIVESQQYGKVFYVSVSYTHLQKERQREEVYNRMQLLSAAKSGDPNAIETLTLEDIDTCLLYTSNNREDIE